MICLGILQETWWWWVSWTLARAEEREPAAAVLTFLDSHCEVNTEWLQPMLQRVKEVSLSVPGGALDVPTCSWHEGG